MTIRVFGISLLLTASLAGQNTRQSLALVVHSTMQGRAGTALVLNVASGKLQAHYGLDVAAKRLAAPGSTIKPFLLLALLHSGHFDPQATMFCRRNLMLSGHSMNCTHPEAATSLNAIEALAYSCNSYFAAAVSHLDAKDLQQEFEQVGLTSLTHLAPKEATGTIAHTSSVERLQLQALGAEGISVTPLELAGAYRRLAARREKNQDSSLQVVYAGLEGSTAYGMAHAAQPAGYAVAGKTGTAGSEHSPLTHGWFAGYAPANNPEIVVVVYLERGRGSDAALLAGQIFTAFGEDGRQKP